MTHDELLAAKRSDLVERLRDSSKLQLCPFDRRAPKNDLMPDDPCPICGTLGTDNAEDRCTGADTSCFSEAADEIERLRETFKQYLYETTHIATPETVGGREYLNTLIPYSAIRTARAVLAPDKKGE